MSSRTKLESLLIERGLGATLIGSEAMEALPDGGPRLCPGAISELVPCGKTGAGITSVALHLAASHTGKVAWIDPGNRLDPATAARTGVALSKLLWLRGGDVDAALQAAHCVVQAGGFTLVVLDLLDQEDRMLRIPRAAWFRLLRSLERERRAALLLLGPRPLSGSCANRVVEVRYAGWVWDETARPLLDRVRIETRVQQSRRDADCSDRRPPQSAKSKILPLPTEFVA